MNTPPPMPQFGGGSRAHLLGQRQQPAEAQILQAVGQLSLGIYSHLATAHLATLDRPHQEADSPTLQQMARDAKTAAEAYFEGLGIATFRQPAKE
jgi:hypothetical protein